MTAIKYHTYISMQLALFLTLIVLIGACSFEPKVSAESSVAEEDDLRCSSVNSEEQELPELLSNEQNISEAIASILRNMICDLQTECPELLSFEGSTVTVEYIHGYIWHEPDRPNESLLDAASEGITCLIRVPLALEYQPKAYILNLGRNNDGTYCYNQSSSYPVGASCMEQFLSYKQHDSKLFNEDIYRFEFSFQSALMQKH